MKSMPKDYQDLMLAHHLYINGCVITASLKTTVIHQIFKRRETMKNITTLITDCAMWKRLDLGTVLMVSDAEASEAIKNGWAGKTVSNNTLRGEKHDN
tara:strand:+ start:52 stop:345 length:294 start_codon:yes stop_codon:yes gene_type:complete